MSPLSTLALTWALLGSPPIADVAVGTRFEVGGGMIPVSPAEPASPGIQGQLDVRGGLRLAGPRTVFVLRAGPRLFGFLPHMAGVLDRPLVFSAADASLTTLLGRRANLSLRAGGGVGELSYANMVEVFDAGTGVASTSILPLVLANAQGSFSFRASRVHTLSLTVDGSLQSVASFLSDAPAAGLIPSFRAVSAQAMSESRLNPRDSLAYRVSFEAFVSDDNGAFSTYRNALSWSHRVDREQSWIFSATGEWVRAEEVSSDYLLPGGSIEHVTGGGRRAPRWTMRSALGLRGFLDRLSFTYLPQVYAQTGVEVRLSPRFRSGLQVFGSTSATEAPNAVSIFETFAGVELPSRLELSNRLDFLFGARALLRGPHLSEFDEGNTQGQFLVFVGIDWNEGTDRERGRFVR